MTETGKETILVREIIEALEEVLARMDNSNDPRLKVAAAHVQQSIETCRFALASSQLD